MKAMLKLFSNFDCLNSNWFESSEGYSVTNDYFGDMVSLLQLNPVRVKEELLKHEIPIRLNEDWPHKEVEELVSYDELISELNDNSGSASLLIFLVEIPDLYEPEDEEPYEFMESIKLASAIKLQAGAACGLFDHFNGGGSLLDMHLLKDHVFQLGQIGNSKYHCLEIEVYGKHRGYTPCEVFGKGEFEFKKAELIYE